MGPMTLTSEAGVFPGGTLSPNSVQRRYIGVWPPRGTEPKAAGHRRRLAEFCLTSRSCKALLLRTTMEHSGLASPNRIPSDGEAPLVRSLARALGDRNSCSSCSRMPWWSFFMRRLFQHFGGFADVWILRVSQ